MRSETDLKAALRRTAARLDVDPPSLEPITMRTHRRSRLRALASAGTIVALLGGLWAAGFLVPDLATQHRASGQGAPAESLFEPAGRPAAELEGLPEEVQLGSTSSGDYSAYTVRVTGIASAEDQEASPPLQAGPRVVKEAELRLRVGHGAFQDAFARAQRLAATHQGFVAESRTGGDGARSGELVVRVPAGRFEAAIADLKALGDLRFEEIAGTDVTGEFIDLRARLRNWRAQERAVRALLGDAGSIAQTLQLERELGRVRLEAERVEGSIRALRDRADLGTITVAMREAGSAPARAEDPGTLAVAWADAREAATDVLATMVVGAGYLLPLLALLLLAYAAFRLVRPRARA